MAGPHESAGSPSSRDDVDASATHIEQARREQLAERLAAVHERIAAAGGADLLPVTKFHPARDLRLLAGLGVHTVGENREQEARSKHEELGGHPAIAMIGQIQTKKANSVARWASAVHTADSEKLIRALSRGTGLALERGDRSTELEVLIQFSADGDPHRGGAVAGDIQALADAISGAPHLRLRGLMTVPPLGWDAREVFTRGRQLLESIADRIEGSPVYSAGMSGDLELAIAEGATVVRVGTDILGPRPSTLDI
ncbi:YggS family pyridoxal phosphate enzyme [Corynebacterium heidelbergense]|uniref:Pyridoxal phosphate homeostasis protein n=1 Tax=Corynebacterium heidelbergense TaxID=2055947 RepID=A0A364VBN8_9CORY|nr:alanine racemase [Corynebacterium heidelbergense]RAV34070.1 YggS family pyridoxal phosphate enzyme [Corynebacterium heidelbergense]WCZ36375.1 hypothetical protein CHEID_04120 [Corynebacterium heidelbergense]